MLHIKMSNIKIRKSLVHTICVPLIIIWLVVVRQSDGASKRIENEIHDTDDDRLLYKSDYTELSGGSIAGERTLRLSESPYLLTGDLDVEQNAKLIVEPGVVMHFAPMVGITVRGVFISVVSNRFFFLTWVDLIGSIYRNVTKFNKIIRYFSSFLKTLQLQILNGHRVVQIGTLNLE